MRREEKLLKTMSAVRTCLDECRETPTPLATLEDFVKGLRRDPQWREEEVEEVAATARRAIQVTTPGNEL
jgi:hypothetical protein